MYKLLYPEFLYLLLLPFFLRIIPPVCWQHQSLYFPSAGGQWQHAVVKLGWRSRFFRFLKWLFLYAGWGLWCLALAAPSYFPPPVKQVKYRRHILLATDLSLSMDTRDWYDKELKRPVSRWEAVKRLNAQFIRARKGDCFAHVVFGQEAYLQVPFTAEPEVILQMQEQLRLGDAGPKTSVGNAIAVAAEHFRSDSITRKMMVLITDGLDTGEGVSPLQMAEEAARDSIVIYTVAMGSPKEGFKNVDHRQLEEIARITGGKAYLASSLEDLMAVSEEIDRLEPMEFVITENQPYRPLYMYPLAISLFVFAIAISVNFIKDIR